MEYLGGHAMSLPSVVNQASVGLSHKGAAWHSAGVEQVCSWDRRWRVACSSLLLASSSSREQFNSRIASPTKPRQAPWSCATSCQSREQVTHIQVPQDYIIPSSFLSHSCTLTDLRSAHKKALRETGVAHPLQVTSHCSRLLITRTTPSQYLLSLGASVPFLVQPGKPQDHTQAPHDEGL